MTETDKDAFGYIDKICRDMNKKSALKQMIYGAMSGWCVGYLGIKIGKITTVAVGGGIILLQIANYNEYIKINWTKINTNIEKISERVEENITKDGPKWMDKVKTFASANTYISTSFVAGLLFGLAYG